VIALVSSRGAAPNTSPVISRRLSGRRSHSTNEAMPACATSPTQLRCSAGISRNHGSDSSIRWVVIVASAPVARSTRCTVAAPSTFAVRRDATAPTLP
jgi:hypothetical protein